MNTDTDVIVTQYRAEFRAAPFARPRWEIVGGWETRLTYRHRRRWTVTREFLTYPGAHSEPAGNDTGIGHIQKSMLIDHDAVVVFVPHESWSRYGIAVVIEQRQR